MRKNSPAAPPAPGWISTADLVKLTNTSRETLYAWVRKGYLQPPRTGPAPSGRGRQSVWPSFTADEIRKLRALSARGVPLEYAHERTQLESSVGSSYRYGDAERVAQEDWRARGTAGALGHRLGLTDADASLYECFHFATMQLARNLGLGGERIARLDTKLAHHLPPAILLFAAGIPPVLVVTPQNEYVAPAAVLCDAPLDDPDDSTLDTALTHGSAGESGFRLTAGAFIAIDLLPILKALWDQWGASNPQRIAAPERWIRRGLVAWDRRDDLIVEYDAAIAPTGRWPVALVLDVQTTTGRGVRPLAGAETSAAPRKVKPASRKPSKGRGRHAR